MVSSGGLSVAVGSGVVVGVPAGPDVVVGVGEPVGSSVGAMIATPGNIASRHAVRIKLRDSAGISPTPAPLATPV